MRRPWTYSLNRIFDADGHCVAECHDADCGIQSLVAASHIVKCVNMYDELVNTLQLFIDDQRLMNLTNKEQAHAILNVIHKATGGVK